MIRSVQLTALVLLAAFAQGQVRQRSRTEAEIKREIISRSIASYRGSCPCPYSTDRAGRNCVRRSAYSRPGGASPTCYERDVTQQMVEEYRRSER
jgi:hypothetical protein